MPVIVDVEGGPAAVGALHGQQPVHGAAHAGFLPGGVGAAGVIQGQQHLRGVVDIGIEFVGELEVPAGRLDIGPLDRPIALAADFLGQQPIGGAFQRAGGGFAGFSQRIRHDGGVPNHRKTGLEEEAALVVDQQIHELGFGFHAIRMVFGITQQIQHHDHVHHGRVNRGEAAGIARMLEHPLLGAADGAGADAARAILGPTASGPGRL